MKLVRFAMWAGVLICIVLPALIVVSLSAIDRGWLDRPIQRWASHKLGRAVHFDALETHLTSSKRSVAVRGLTISGPGWARGNILARVERLDARVELLPLLRGEVRIPYLALVNPRLELVRLRDGRNNWSLPGSSPDRPAFAALAGTQTLRIIGGKLSLDDRVRKLRFGGNFSQDDSSSMPFRLVGRGMLRGGGIELAARGGPLHGTAVGRPYPFVAHLADCGLSLDARGTSGEPFDLVRYDLTIAARGPNLADFVYLFGLQTPSSAPFALTTHAQADGPHVTFANLKGQTGGSDFGGWIRSDQSTSRHKVTAALRSRRWSKADVQTWLSPQPSREVARTTSGRRAVQPDGPWILSAEPFPVEQLRAVDFVAAIDVTSLDGYSLPLRSVKARVTLDHGKLSITKLNAALHGGMLWGDVRLDVTGTVPVLKIDGDARGVDLGRLQMPPSSHVAGLLDLRVRMEGAGRSVHLAAGSASGDATMRITTGKLPQPAAFLLGGDLLRAAGTLGKTNSPITLICARAHVAGSGGKMLVRDLGIGTAEGVTTGQGSLDLGSERIDLLFMQISA